ncbi:MAG TPA: SPFH domain-containing protein [Acetobacteraceae bacterium]|nr:SPFH domain-containing protein [Acetobacteraceae bacterium]
MSSPLLQSAGIAYKLVVAGTLALAALWLGSNIRQVPPDATAVVLRFGRVADIRSSGLVLALPHPIDEVVLLPGPDRQLGLSIAPLPRPAGLDPASAERPALRDAARAAQAAAPKTAEAGAAGVYLTADGGAVLLDAELTYQLTDPVAYMLAEPHIAPALNRIFRASAVTIASRSPLDDFLVVDQTRGAARPVASARLRAALLAEINRRVRSDAELGVAVARVDLTAALAPAAKAAFDSVLTATQMADQALANARTDATRRAQDADRERDRLLAEARAQAAERIAAARTHADTVLALARNATPDLPGQLYRERIGAIVAQVGQVLTVDARPGPRLILPAERR